MPYVKRGPSGAVLSSADVPQIGLGITEWVDEMPATLIELKLQRAVDITAASLAAIEAGFEFDGHRYDSDLISRTNIIGTAAGLHSGIALPEGFTWRTSDNQNVPMDAVSVIALCAALLQHVNEQYATSWQLKAEIEAAPTAEDVAAVVWPPSPSQVS